ncbi:hypothetical protein Fmac_016392 [Flemingia macrophylla]|uniref:RING-type domain-containing protein n=1 Tax=Flemingia macrophylla TaxID=520843 RepID=A0ABD1MHD9_9FABA
MTTLPPLSCFLADDQSQCDCPICIEEFKNGDLVQPFGVCVHQFHSSCINTWLLLGRTTCPVCRTPLVTL